MNRSKPEQKKLLIHLIAAARPNFMKIAPLYHALKKEDWAVPLIVHTGQHYDINMSDAFFSDLNLPEPNIHLGVGSGTHAEQTGQVMMKYEKVLIETQPDLVVVVGDVNSTLACALAASKVVYPKNIDKKRVTSRRRLKAMAGQGDEYQESSIQNRPYTVSPRAERSSSAALLKPAPLNPDYIQLGRSAPPSGQRPLIAHLEAGLRSFDRTMPEEINRTVTDALSDVLWTPSPDADENLIREGVSPTKIHQIGNIMIDSLEMLRDKIERTAAYDDFSLVPGDYGLVTLHRPSNVDNQEFLEQICQKLISVADKIPLIFPVHPRTQKSLRTNGLASILKAAPNLHIIKPLNYIRFMSLLFNCRLAVTDSGGIQEETTYLGIPCLTLRPNTERPITIMQGTNQLCEPENLEKHVRNILSSKYHNGKIPEHWDGQTAIRATKSIRNLFSKTIN